MTIVARGDDKILEQIIKQLNKLIDVIKVNDLTTENHIERELVLLKVSTEGKKRSEIMEIVDIFRAKIIDVAPKTLTIEVTGDEDKIQAITSLFKPFGIKEFIRTGKIAITRG
jgi:acetolactate synthase-1/3 small subunit